MKATINSNPLEFEGLRHKQKVQRPAAQLHSIQSDQEFVQESLAQLPPGQNKKRPPLTMEPSIDDPLAAVKNIMRRTYLAANDSEKLCGATV
ncbi:MAG TPA: hypothetical protein DCG57_12150 [Candidatus Riflebacteria bacterium]|jgi:hypothetical protein|nr:hypothetical protein [Candidatus Riflebacteria bacterium]